ncbi:DNA helicase/exodeoxyribonuclease V, alpha subunit [Alkalispirochaeta americana]|uniref:RecBCD enzyme subunit RecD n=1 Tax=Alkalispirochaeta americana TaxID=159291 RepID=A0A1N6PCD4_9SPIO|nr:exodeoxyribonuclease V subunit alpha [Alkalispirochaeta americana]SIQ01973.1 DNA helicase/exodeoxyribonuclease V, alpha subunit [Alkalispirochaeta americana]
MRKNDLLHALDRWAAAGMIRDIDRSFVQFLRDEAPEADPLVLLGALLVSCSSGAGHSCLDLKEAAAAPEQALFSRDESSREEPIPLLLPGTIDLDEWVRALRESPLTDPESTSPLVFLESPSPRLALRRFYRQEQAILRGIAQRAEPLSLDPARIRPRLEGLFQEDDTHWPRIAAAVAARNRFSVITGGPGTGKTTTVLSVLALLHALEGPLRIRLAAPTGKAAVRLQESIHSRLEDLDEDVRETIPRNVTTLHRLLGMGRRGQPAYGPILPLPADLVVVDEASMVDVALMAALFEALRPETRLILLGDKDQLASVEAGSVLADLCSRAEDGYYTPETARWIQESTGVTLPEALQSTEGSPLDQQITMLRKSFRFSSTGGIGLYATSVRGGRLPQNHQEDQTVHRIVPRTNRDEEFRRICRTSGAYLLRMNESRPPQDAPLEAWERWALTVLEERGRFQILCALRQGPWGVEQINQRVREELVLEGLIPAEQTWYPGQPLMITRNDYRLQLMNGDIGLVLDLPGALRAAFPGDEPGTLRWVLPARLQETETAFAMTVHKSQGSEFDHTVLVLPDTPAEILTRELIYTGITRAKTFLSLVEPNPETLTLAVKRRVLRQGGLAALLHQS